MSCSPLAEAFLCQPASVLAPLATQNISTAADAAVLAAKLQSSVVLLDADNLALQQCFNIPATAGLPLSRGSSSNSSSGSSSSVSSSIQGVVLSPTGTHIAAYTSTQLLVAAVANKPSRNSQQQQTQNGQQQQQCSQAVGQFQCAAVPEGGIRSVHWGLAGMVLAACSKEKPEVKLFTFTGCPAAASQQQQQQQQLCQAGVLTPLLTLHGPDKHSKGPTTATWLPSAIPQDSSSSSGSDGMPDGSAVVSACSTAGLLVSWPNHLLLFTWAVAADGCINWSRYVTHDILTGWPGPPRALVALQPTPISTVPVAAGIAAAAAAAGSGCAGPGGNLSSSQLAHQQLVRVVAAVDAAPAWQLAQQEGVSTPTAGAGADGSTAASTVATGMSADVLRPLGLLPGSAAGVDASSGGVLDSLMNISGQQQQQQQTGSSVLQQPLTRVLTPGTTRTAATTSSTKAAAGSCLCLLTIDLQWLNVRQTANGSTAGSSNTHSFRLQQAGAESPVGDSSEFVSVMPLPQQPLPRFLAAQGALVAVGSSTGAPRVTLCSVSHSRGLQALHTITVPVPKALTAAAAMPADSSKDSGGSSSSKQARLQGLLLLPASQAAAASAAGGDASKGAATNVVGGMSLIALLACSKKPSGGVVGSFGGFGSSSSSSSSSKNQGCAVDLHLVKVALGADIAWKQPAGSRQQTPTVATAAAANGGDTELLTELGLPQQQHHHHRHDQAAAHQQQGQQQQQAAARHGSAAVVAALQALQSSLEGRLDAIQHTLQRMDQRLQALERRAGA